MRTYDEDIIRRAEKIKLLLLDVDGVLTDGGLIYTDKGYQIKQFNVKDGLGIALARKAGIKCAVLTAKKTDVVRARCRDLAIDKVYQDVHYKIEVLNDILETFSVSEENICFVGDDLIDIPILRRAGLAVCPANAVAEVAGSVHFITQKNGGSGAVREEVTRRYFE
jgi:3-deoxy-D-manno-octulosonate 8-phosphate phosphatase (KDO 8-P phosphatase)